MQHAAPSASTSRLLEGRRLLVNGVLPLVTGASLVGLAAAELSAP